jgi:hypothetical protein
LIRRRRYEHAALAGLPRRRDRVIGWSVGADERARLSREQLERCTVTAEADQLAQQLDQPLFALEPEQRDPIGTGVWIASAARRDHGGPARRLDEPGAGWRQLDAGPAERRDDRRLELGVRADFDRAAVAPGKPYRLRRHIGRDQTGPQRCDQHVRRNWGAPGLGAAVAAVD